MAEVIAGKAERDVETALGNFSLIAPPDERSARNAVLESETLKSAFTAGNDQPQLMLFNASQRTPRAKGQDISISLFLSSTSNPISSSKLLHPLHIDQILEATMQLQSFLTAIAALGIGISPVLALPEPIPALVDHAQLAERAQCIAGGKRAGSHCEAGNLGALACSNDNTALVSFLRRLDQDPARCGRLTHSLFR